MERDEEDKKEKEIEEIPEKKEEIPNKKGKLTEKMRENPWVLSTLVLGVVTLILLVGNFSGGMTGDVISEDVAGERILEFVNSQVDGEVELVEINFENGLYEVVVLFEEREIPVYITADGKNLVQSVTPLDVIMQEDQQEPEDWSIFENDLPENIKSKILSFNYEEPEVYDEELRINEFKNYELIPKTLIVFYNPGCGACRGYFPVLVEAMEKYPEITIYALNSGQNADLAEKYDVTGVPTTIINVKYKIVGSRPLESLSEILNKLN